jgi:hypothetical protein
MATMIAKPVDLKDTRTVKDRLSIITTTHLIPSAPSVWILHSTIQSLRKRLPVEGCRHLIYYDAPQDGGTRHERYLANLRDLCRRFDLELFVRPESGLKANMIEGLRTVTTPYMLFLEHDWRFRRPVDLERLLGVFDKYNFVNIVKFNIRNNDSRVGWDHFVEPEEEIAEIPLVRTSCWSNNPHVVRVSKWREEWFDVVGPERSERSFGIEEKLYWSYGKDIFTKGFREAHREWGSFIYGNLWDKPLVYHSNGSLSVGPALEYFAKLRRLVNRKLLRRHN